MTRLAIVILLSAILFNGASILHGQDSNHVLGTAEDTLSAYTYPDGGESCTIEVDDIILAIAQTDSGALLVYSGGISCEGTVWIQQQDIDNVAWEDQVALAELVQVETPQMPEELPPLSTLANHDDICNNAVANGYGNVTGETPYLIFTQNGNIAHDYRATTTDELDLVTCIEQLEIVRTHCLYGSGTVDALYLHRIRLDLIVRLVDYQSGHIVQDAILTGGPPQPCPYYTTEEAFYGELPGDVEWAEWAMNYLARGEGAIILRTTVDTYELNARAEPNTESEILTSIRLDTPLNIIARNEEGNWVVALMPDMSKAWFHAGLLRVSTKLDFDALLVVDGLAQEVEITVPPTP
jgi:hypothetical protein